MQTKFLLLITAAVSLIIACTNDLGKPKIKTSYHIHSVRNVGPEAAAHPDPGFSVTEAVNNSNNPQLSDGVVDTFTYDESGKIISVNSSNGNKTVNAQTGNIFISTTIDAGGHVNLKRKEFENNAGLSDSAVIEQIGSIVETKKYMRDEKGHKIEEKIYGPGTAGNEFALPKTAKFRFRGDDILSETYLIPPMVDTITIINPQTLNEDTVIQRTAKSEITTYFDYYKDKLNTTKRNSASAHLVKRAVMIYNQIDTSEVNDYYYTFDSQGRIISEVYRSRAGYIEQGNSFLEYDSTAYTYY